MAETRIAVIGAGLAGSLLALELAGRGLAVTLVDGAGQRATALSYGGVAWWAGAPGPLGRLIRWAPQRWRQLEARHGPLGWQRCGLRLHGAGAASLLRLPFARVDTVALARNLPAALRRAGLVLVSAQMTAPPVASGSRWRLLLEPAGDLEVDQLVLTAGAGCRALWPDLPVQLRTSWAGVMTMKTLPSGPGGPWLEHARRGRMVLPRHLGRPALEARADRLQQEAWEVDAGLAPWGLGLLAGQSTVVRPELHRGEPPDAEWMEKQLRRGLADLDPELALLQGRFRQVPVAFGSEGRPLVGPVPAAVGLWVFSGFSGAFAQVPVLAPLLAEVIAGTAGLGQLERLGVLPG